VREARARGEALRVLSAREGQTLEALGDTLLPGAAEAGIAHYVDGQLASASPLLMLKYVDFPMPYADFYRQGLAALDAVAGAGHDAAFAALAAEQRNDLVREISAATPDGWSGPPAPLFYFVTRNDALDVVYGTEEGFARLEVPYRAHVAPPAKW
jgi:hypothetical protein